MLTVTILNPYKSIIPFDPPKPFNMEDFFILTGVNGSGKSQLLQTMSDRDYIYVRRNGNLLDNIIYLPFNNLHLEVPNKASEKEVEDFISSIFTRLQNHLHDNPSVAINNIITRQDGYDPDAMDPDDIAFIHAVRDKTGKRIADLSIEDLKKNCDVSFINKNYAFSSNFGLIFLNYHNRYIDNKFLQFLNQQGLSNEVPLSDEEFISYYGPAPWEFINSFFKKLDLGFQVSYPSSCVKDAPFHFTINNEEGKELHYDDLSTGEKLVLALAFIIYGSDSGLGKPDMLLLDEPDSGLHPSLASKLFKVIKEEVVEKLNIPVAISTHSPVSLIAAGGVPVYEMKKGKIPKKVNSERAILSLSGDIPYLKISTDNRRQVFVESGYDVSYYEYIRNALRKYNPEAISCELVFLETHKDKTAGSNCDDVKRIVNLMGTNGNDRVYGIIDYDNHNPSHDNIIVLGNGERYAIENYILDPLLLALFLIRERKWNPSDLGLSFTSIVNAKSLSPEDAQKMVDKVLSDLGLDTGPMKEYTLVNGWELHISQSFCTYRGHDLETKIKNTYPFLKSFKIENALKIEIAKIIIDDFPELLPQDLLLTLQSIH
ncbi:MAG: AAA family ATPase [Muribaculaceae bacterium]|nr:AAA family ATPase [Muribaculaceae bacterium]